MKSSGPVVRVSRLDAVLMWQKRAEEWEERAIRAEIQLLDMANASQKGPVRVRLPDTRKSLTQHFRIRGGDDGDTSIYVTVGFYEDGRPGEIFIVVDKSGSLARGAFDGFATAVSIGLQSGIGLKTFVDKMLGMRFEPRGFTGNEKYPICKSVLDLIGQWLRDTFLPPEPEAKEKE